MVSCTLVLLSETTLFICSDTDVNKTPWIMLYILSRLSVTVNVTLFSPKDSSRSIEGNSVALRKSTQNKIMD